MYGIGELARVEIKEGLFYRLDARVKLLLILLVSVMSVTLDNTWSLAALYIAVTTPILMSRVGPAKLKFLVTMAVLLVWGTMLSQAVFYNDEPRTIMFTLVRGDAPVAGRLLGEVNIYREGFLYGAVQSLRFCSMISIGLLVCWTTGIDDMLAGMLALRVPYILAFMTVTAIRFLPAIVDEVATVRLAMKIRGGRIFSLNPFKTVMNVLKLARPVFTNCYRRSGTLALSVQSRAFTPGAERTGSGRRKMSLSDITVLYAAAVVTLSAVIMKTIFWMYVNDIYYHSNLRFLYEICRYYI